MELKDIIRDYKNRFQLSNKDLAETFGVTPNTITRWLHGDIKNLQDETADRISQKIGYDVQTLLKGKEINLKRPILGLAKAGYDMFLQDNYLGEEDVSTNEFKNGSFYLKVVGDSMNASGIIDGGLVYVQSCSTVSNGDIAVIAFNDEVTIKKYYVSKDGITLKATNPDVTDKHFTLTEAKKAHLRIIGKVIFAKNYM